MINKNEYLEKNKLKKTVILPSGFELEIFKISARSFVNEKMLPILSSNEIGIEKTKEEITKEFENSKPEEKEKILKERMILCEKLIKLACPELNNSDDNFFKLEDLEKNEEDYNFLLNEVTIFSLGRGQDLKPFR